MFRKILISLLVVVMLSMLLAPSALAASKNAYFQVGSDIMTANGKDTTMDTVPYIKDGRVYVPVRYMAEALGAAVKWNPVKKSVTISAENKTMVLSVGDNTCAVGGTITKMDVAPEITDGRVMLPARYVAEGFGYIVTYYSALQVVLVQKPLV